MATMQPWWNDGLRFACTRCGDCCSGNPGGAVWVNRQEVRALACRLMFTVAGFLKSFTRRIDGRTSLRERPNGDCIFYDRAKGCTVYSDRPGQCRAWPFWKRTVASPEAWDHTCQVCPGSGQGQLFTADEITARLREARGPREP